MNRWIALLVFVAAFGTVTKLFAEERRVAMVIGNGAYRGGKDMVLMNPANDATDLAAKLRKLGFEVHLSTDIGLVEMQRAIRQLGNKITPDSVVLFYYAGHGIQDKGRNFLIPVDALLRDESSLASQTLSVDDVLAVLGRARLSMVILDACRNTPFATQLRGGTRGLAKIEPPSGMLIAYATSPGKLAFDGSGRNGLYTSELLRVIDAPNLKVEDVFKRVRIQVANASGQQQIPWESSSMVGDFYFSVTESSPDAATGMVMPAVVAVPATPSVDTVGMARPGQIIQDCQECPPMVVLPLGVATIGSSQYETERHDKERPQRQISITSSVAIGRTEVTVAEFRAFVRASGYRTDAENNNGLGGGCATIPMGTDQWTIVQGKTWTNPGFAQAEQHPAVCVTWNDAQAYARWLSTRTGQIYRLPSEAEWEWAARAGVSASRFWGDNPDDACRYANVFDSNAAGRLSRTITETPHRCSDGHTYTSPVASFSPNSFGLFDMLGNAGEWVEDCDHPDYVGAPMDGSAWIRGGDCTRRISRGGAWNSSPRYVRSADRYGAKAGLPSADSGFRVLRIVKPRL